MAKRSSTDHSYGKDIKYRSQLWQRHQVQITAMAKRDQVQITAMAKRSSTDHSYGKEIKYRSQLWSNNEVLIAVMAKLCADSSYGHLIKYWLQLAIWHC
jgi:tetrahydromethanopterin S-methyltransferase subunit F